jgi:O-antigen/teichoic acid export membrane protein
MRTMMSVIFPLITFPYSSRVLGPENLGKVDYAQANLTYCTLIASFGIGSYAVREGARIRDDRKKIEQFSAEMLAINLITLAVSYIVFFASLAIPKLSGYRSLMLIFSTTIILSAVGVEWLYNIYEDYIYITVRAFAFQLISVVLLFTCVRDEQDYIRYAVVLVISSAGSNIMNLFRARKYIRLRVSFNKKLLEHIKPMCYIFAINVASSIYLVMDRSMLGYLTTDWEVGQYAVAIKITSVVSGLMVSVRTIMTPRVAYLMNTDADEAERLNYVTSKILLMLSIPSAIGMGLLSRRVLLLFAGEQYLEATPVLRILLTQMVFSCLNGFLVNQLFMTQRKEKWGSTAVVLGAITNLVMNSIAIPRCGMYGAALSTVASELVIFVYSIIRGRNIFDISRLGKQFFQSALACVPMVFIYYAIEKYMTHNIWIILWTMVLGAVSYFLVLMIMKNELVKSGIEKILDKIKG